MDVDDSYSKLLLHCNGDDASTTIVDEAGHTVEAMDNAQLDTAYKKFGSAALLINTSGDYVRITDSADFDLGDGDFTIDFWIKVKESYSYAGIMSKRPSASSLGWCLALGANSVVEWRGKVGGSFAWPKFAGTTQLDDDTWHHVALVRNGTSWKIYIDGVLDGSDTISGAVDNQSGYLAIGAESSAGEAAGSWGSIDEIRLSVGIARWTDNFTPPTHEYGVEYKAYAKNFKLKVLYGVEPRVVT